MHAGKAKAEDDPSGDAILDAGPFEQQDGDVGRDEDYDIGRYRLFDLVGAGDFRPMADHRNEVRRPDGMREDQRHQ
jgi:hypothetical protein